MPITSDFSPEQKTINAISGISVSGIQQRVRTYCQLFDLFWNNRFGLSPQDVAVALGTSAGELFELAGEEQTVLPAAAAKAGSPLASPLPSVPSGWAVAFDSAGNAFPVFTPNPTEETAPEETAPIA